MFCGKCGSNNPDDNSFCSVCGAPIGASFVKNISNPVYQYQQPMQVVLTAPQPAAGQTKNGMATAGLVMGILGAVSSLATFSYTSSESELGGIIMVIYSFAILGVIFSAIGLKKSIIAGGKGKAIAGLILSIMSFFVPVLGLGIATYMKKASEAASNGSVFMKCTDSFR